MPAGVVLATRPLRAMCVPIPPRSCSRAAPICPAPSTAVRDARPDRSMKCPCRTHGSTRKSMADALIRASEPVVLSPPPVIPPSLPSFPRKLVPDPDRGRESIPVSEPRHSSLLCKKRDALRKGTRRTAGSGPRVEDDAPMRRRWAVWAAPRCGPAPASPRAGVRCTLHDRRGVRVAPIMGVLKGPVRLRGTRNSGPSMAV